MESNFPSKKPGMSFCSHITTMAPIMLHACFYLHQMVTFHKAPDGTRHDLMMAQWSKIYDAIDNVFDWLNGRAKFVVDSDACPSLITSYQI
jgi:hypothetical protein